MTNLSFQNSIYEKCKQCMNLFDTEIDSFSPLTIFTPPTIYTFSKNESLYNKCFSIMNCFNDITIPTASSYYSNNLLCLYDAKENTGYNSHNNSSSSWKNLVYQYTHASDISTNNTSSWNDDCLNILENKNLPFSNSNIISSSSGITIECCCKLHDTSCNGWYCPISIGDNNRWMCNRRRIVLYSTTDNTYINTYQRNISTNPESGESYTSYKTEMNAYNINTISTYMENYNFNTNTDKLYVNANVITETIPTTSIVSDGVSLCRYVNGTFIGSEGWDGKDTDNNLVNVFKGKIYCVRIYAGELTQEQISYNHSIDLLRFN